MISRFSALEPLRYIYEGPVAGWRWVAGSTLHVGVVVDDDVVVVVVAQATVCRHARVTLASFWPSARSSSCPS